MEIVAALSVAKTCLDLIKGIREAAKKKTLTSDEITDYLSTLQDKIVDIKTALVEAEDENRQLKKELQEAKRMADFGADFTTGEGLYWREKYPYCPSCWDIDRKPVRLGGPVHDIARGEIWQCPVHKVHHITRQRH
jgi:hypothetical protein